MGQAVEEVFGDRGARGGRGERFDGAAARGWLDEWTGRRAGWQGGEGQPVHGHDGDTGRDEGLYGWQVVELVGHAWREAGLGAEVLHQRSEATGWCVAARQNQRLIV